MSIFPPRSSKRLFAARTWRGLSRLLFGLRGGILLLRRARRRDCARRWTGPRCAQWLLRRGRRTLCPSQFRAFFQPSLIFGRFVDHDCPFHSVMTETAELTANHLVIAGFDRFKPHWNERAGNRIRRNAHVRQAK